uniref:Uncharacterized protein n=1 Tax=Arundo donax TaxID=35708 RepID=A0A0A8YZW8_ARUDO
MLSVSFPLDP